MDDRSTPLPATQYAALPYRRSSSGDLEILLITSRGSGQWIIPKGKPIPGLTPSETAAREAFEEAGIRGEVAPRPIGRFDYVKDAGLSTARHIPAVEVYAMHVTQQLTLWPEMGQRRMIWMDADRAADHIEIDKLRDIVRRFQADQPYRGLSPDSAGASSVASSVRIRDNSA